MQKTMRCPHCKCRITAQVDVMMVYEPESQIEAPSRRSIQDRIVRMISEKGMVKIRDIIRAFQHDHSAPELRAIMHDMAEAGIVDAVDLTTARGPNTIGYIMAHKSP